MTYPILGIVVAASVAILYFTGYLDWSKSDEDTVAGSQNTAAAVGNQNAAAVNDKPTVNVNVPDLKQVAKLGEADFNASCASCHGKNAAGNSKGPPLVHLIYRQNHHADIAFKLAVDQGVRAHHWRFGNMPAQENISDQELARIVVYIRTLQRANGIN